ncbi:glucans biosynthesis glucosyltransferase MdoH [Afipia sp. Root123D2]|uniref:glucans biosynthesis glucosyltransferase MdoH n=1 Tax=Afipia sp. Root123D2 TaxID=1736436 RepID=UPI0009E983D2|nr:glucans biosynthesis glucosyltransferase MdoH [Afipia sp. Root123D2]
MDPLRLETAKPRNVSSATAAEVSGPFLPADAPMEMAAQSFWLRSASPRRTQLLQSRTAVPRVCIFLGTVAMTTAGAYEMYEVLQVGGLTTLEAIVLALFVILFAWVSFSFTSALAGFVRLVLRGHDPFHIETGTPIPDIDSRNAMLLPTYNENPYRVMARLQAIFESVEGTGHGFHFDWFVLSDTSDPAIWIAEEKAILEMRARTRSDRIYYRHRPRNIARKSGNIEDWVKRFGARYEHMIVLDADSLMTGDTIVRLVSELERHHDVALIQTLPVVVNARTMFARLQQFAGRLYGPMIAAGVAWWHGSEGNYWGHNAIIRVRAFADNAGLPEMAGRKPFGGHILSHDFIEAALMRRGGWAIHMAPGLGGSFEECPPSLIDFAARDRRWCQGNLQHLAVLPARKLHWVSRLHLLTGIGSYLTAPLWLLFLALGILISLQAQFIRPEYFGNEYSLFPKWPAQDPIRAAKVFAVTMGLLVVPKLLAYILLLTQTKNRKRFGGGTRVLLGIVIETILSGLIAPVMMIFQSAAVSAILMGRDAGWQVQRRDDGGIAVREMLSKYAMPSIFGVTMALTAYAVSLPLFLWMTPVIGGLLFSIPLAVLTSRPSSHGRSSSLFATPEEITPPPVLRRANELAQTASDCIGNPLHELRDNVALRERHLEMIKNQAPRERGQIDPDLAVARAKLDDADAFDDAVGFLNNRETFALLNSESDFCRLMQLPDPSSVAP